MLIRKIVFLAAMAVILFFNHGGWGFSRVQSLLGMTVGLVVAAIVLIVWNAKRPARDGGSGR
jgi:hypothetical protein